MLYYFKPDEFQRDGVDWLPQMSPRLLVMLDVLRHQWGQPIQISGSREALGRYAGDSQSQHNVDQWGEVRAADIMPAGILQDDQAHDFFMLARSIGFTGLGFYPDWNPAPGFHLDVREDHKPGDPATWGGVLRQGHQVYVSMNDALEHFA